jgi:hypothetical protein
VQKGVPFIHIPQVLSYISGKSSQSPPPRASESPQRSTEKILFRFSAHIPTKRCIYSLPFSSIQNFLNLCSALQNLKKHGYEHDASYHNGCYAKEIASLVSIFSIDNPKQTTQYKKQSYKNRNKFINSFCHSFLPFPSCSLFFLKI